MARREPARRKRRPGGARGSGKHIAGPEPAAVTRAAAAPVDARAAGRAALEARIAFALGAMAFLALPITYQWTVRPQSRPPGSDILLQLIEIGAILAAAAALLLGRRARAAGDRSAGAVWAPRLGAASIVGYAMVFFLLFTRGS